MSIFYQRKASAAECLKRWAPDYGISPAMQAIADLKASNELPADVRAQAIASMPDIWDED